MSLGLLLVLLGALSQASRFSRASLLIWGGGPGIELYYSWDVDPSKMIVAGALYLLVLAMLLHPRQPYLRVDLPFKFLGALIAWSFLALAWSYDPGWSFIWTLRLAQWVVVYLLVITFTRSRDDLHRWSHLFLYSSFINLVGVVLELTIREKIGHIGTAAGEFDRALLTGYPARALMYLPFAFHCVLWRRNRVEGGLGAACIVFNLAAIYISGRRAGPLVLVVVLVAYFLLIGRRHRGFLIACIAILIAGIVAVKLNPYYAWRLSTIPFLGGAGLEQWEGDPRIIQYREGLAIFAQHPIGGIGLNGALLWVKHLYGYGLGQHSVFLAMASELGLVGLFLYLLFAGFAAMRSLAAVRGGLGAGDRPGASLGAAALTSLLAMLVWGQFQSLVFSMPIYISAGLCSVSYGILEQKAGQASSGGARDRSGRVLHRPPG